MYKLGVIQFISHPALDTFRKLALQELKQKGFAEGKNLLIEYENAQGRVSNAEAIASRLVSSGNDAIFCITSPACMAGASATSSIPVVFGYVTDAIAAGLVTRLNQPGGNITGVLTTEPVAEQMHMVQMIASSARRIGVIWHPGEPNSQVIVKQMKDYALQSGITIIDAHVYSPAEVLAVAQSLARRVDAIFVPGDNTAQAALSAVVQVCETDELPLFASEACNVDQGAIAAYSYSPEDIGRQTGHVLAQVLGGQRPATIDVQLPTCFKLSINLQAARRMGVTIPTTVIQNANRVIS